ncbi:hypothetical protein P0C28_11195 [Aeromonas hydrophila]|uniref:hypothetical protein n=1 Tax=Aeromonas hydrophila TaxID=644 RepID=UPI0023B03C84|nr:hypothetical protein [Aeromonas hydrophila]MDE8809819.1 hypothetical protein [Aeromonas hydrophila]
MDTIKWENVEDRHKRELRDGTKLFRCYIPYNGDMEPSLIVHILFNDERYGFNNIFNEPVPWQEIQDLYKKCLIGINTIDDFSFEYRGISFSCGVDVDDICWNGFNGSPTKTKHCYIDITNDLKLYGTVEV